MARKKDDGFALVVLGILIGTAVLGVFLINTVCVFHHYNKKYNFSEATARVSDSLNFTRFIPAAACVAIFAFFTAGIFLPTNGQWPQSAGAWLLTVSLGLIWLCVCVLLPFMLISARLATTQAGLLVYAQRGYFVMPADWNKNTFTENFLRLKIVEAAYDMDRLELSEVTKVTREGGKTALIHGDFGSRKISWRTKQKRDECVAALENACGRRLGSYL